MNTILLLCIFITLVYSLDKRMYPIPFYEPPSEISSVTYYQFHQDDLGYQATVLVQASTPSFHLINLLHHLQTVECNSVNQLQLVMNSTESISKWERTPTLLIIDAQFECLGNDSIFLIADSWTIHSDNQTVIFQTRLADESNIEGEMTILIDPVNLTEMMHHKRPKSMDMDILDPQNHPNALLDLTIPINLSLSISIRLGKYTYLECKGCNIKGSVGLHFRLKISLFKKTIAMLVYISGSLDVLLSLGVGLKEKYFDLRRILSNTPLPPLIVPGIFSIIPSLLLWCVISFGFQQDIIFDSTIHASASNFRLQLIKLGNTTEFDKDILEEPQVNLINIKTHFNKTTDRLRSFASFKIVPEFHMLILVFNIPISLGFGLVNGFEALVDFQHSGEDCRDLLVATLKARVNFILLIYGIEASLKETSLKLTEKCFKNKTLDGTMH